MELCFGLLGQGEFCLRFSSPSPLPPLVLSSRINKSIYRKKKKVILKVSLLDKACVSQQEMLVRLSHFFFFFKFSKFFWINLDQNVASSKSRLSTLGPTSNRNNQISI